MKTPFQRSSLQRRNAEDAEKRRAATLQPNWRAGVTPAASSETSDALGNPSPPEHRGLLRLGQPRSGQTLAAQEALDGLHRIVLRASLRNSAFSASLRSYTPVFVQVLLLALATPLAHAKLNVVATTPDLAAIAQEIGGNLADVTTLARPTEDPHFIDAKPSFITKLNKADVLLHGGAELESAWLSPLLSGARNARIVAAAKGDIRCCEGVPMLEVPAALDRSQGDIHAAGNPHFMVDPVNAKTAAHHIADAFATFDASQAATYQANYKRFAETLDAKMVEWQKKLAPFKGARIAAYHNSWPYFANRFGLVIDVFLEPKPGIPPSPAHLAQVITKMKEQKVKVIFHDPYLDRRTADSVAAATGATVVHVTQYPGGVKGSEGGYVQMMDYLVNTVATALATQAK